MNKWPRCKDCVRDNYLREPVCQTCVAGSNFLPRGRSKIYYESVQEMNQPPAAYRAMVQALRRLNCTPKVGQESQRKGCRNLWEKNCSVRN